MADPVSIGLTTVGGILADKMGRSPSQQSYGSLKGAFKAADEAGIHRLAVAGSPAGYTPAPSAAGQGLMAAGQMVADGKLDKKQSQLIDAQIAEATSRTQLNNANTVRALQGPQPGLGGRTPSSPNPEAFDRAAAGGPRGVRTDPERDVPATQTVTLGNQTGRGFNPDAFEIGLSELLAGALMYGPQWLYGAAKDQDRTSHRQRPSGGDLRDPRNRGM